GVALAQADAAAGTQLAADGGEITLVARTGGRVIEVGNYALGDPFAGHDEERLTAWTRLGQHQIHTVNARRLTDEAQNLRNGSTHIRSFQQQPASLRRRRQQLLTALQALADLGDLLLALARQDAG